MNDLFNRNRDDIARDDQLARLLSFAKENGRVCPKPIKWNELWEMLPERRRAGAGWEPPLPLILAAWWDCSAKEKQDRLELHLRYAAEHGALKNIEQFLYSLKPDEWVYGDGT